MATVEAPFTIEQLAAETGLTVRNIRSHRTLGLMPPPVVRDGIGYYGDEHVRRLRLVRELQADGFNLKGIKQLLDATNDTDVLLRLRRLMQVPLATAAPVILTRRELEEQWPPDEPGAFQAAIDAGILLPLGDERFEVPNPLHLRIAVENRRYGIPQSAALVTYQRVRELCEEIAALHVGTFVEHVWRPFEAAGFPEERWTEIAEAIEHLTPLAAEGLMSIYAPAMADLVEETLGRELRRVSGEA